jgi:acyl-CoA dehydrogenase
MSQVEPRRGVFTAEHEGFRDQARRFVAEHIIPYHAQWENDGIVPRDVWRAAGALGLLCVTLPERYGGAGGDFGYSAVIIEELAKANASGIGFSLHSDVVAPYILAYATEEAKGRWLPGMARGELIGAIAMTEPGVGSDLKAIRTGARRQGDEYVINGQKTFITNGQNSGLVIVVAKTDPDAGRKGISLICVEEGAPGFSKGRNLEKIGLHAQDTSELFFDNVRVPVQNRLGDEGLGFKYLMHQLAQERLIIAIRAAASMESMLDETVRYTKQRMLFEKTLFEMQNTRFKLAEARAQSAMFRVFCDECLGQHIERRLTPERAAMAKLLGSEMQNKLLDDFLQLHGGYGYMKEYAIGRAWLDARVMRIYAGSSEIMKEIIARTL